MNPLIPRFCDSIVRRQISANTHIAGPFGGQPVGGFVSLSSRSTCTCTLYVMLTLPPLYYLQSNTTMCYIWQYWNMVVLCTCYIGGGTGGALRLKPPNIWALSVVHCFRLIFHSDTYTCTLHRSYQQS